MVCQLIFSFGWQMWYYGMTRSLWWQGIQNLLSYMILLPFQQQQTRIVKGNVSSSQTWLKILDTQERCAGDGELHWRAGVYFCKQGSWVVPQMHPYISNRPWYGKRSLIWWSFETVINIFHNRFKIRSLPPSEASKQRLVPPFCVQIYMDLVIGSKKWLNDMPYMVTWHPMVRNGNWLMGETSWRRRRLRSQWNNYSISCDDPCNWRCKAWKLKPNCQSTNKVPTSNGIPDCMPSPRKSQQKS